MQSAERPRAKLCVTPAGQRGELIPCYFSPVGSFGSMFVLLSASLAAPPAPFYASTTKPWQGARTPPVKTAGSATFLCKRVLQKAAAESCKPLGSNSADMSHYYYAGGRRNHEFFVLFVELPFACSIQLFPSNHGRERPCASSLQLTAIWENFPKTADNRRMREALLHSLTFETSCRI